MAINFGKKYNKINGNYSSNNSRGSNLSSRTLLTLNLVDDGLSDSKISKRKNNKLKSPYLDGDMLSRVKEKKVVHKKTPNIVSSFPLAVNIYKASSDEFKSQRKIMKKIKKSVLTLPNVPAVAPQTCTVSDMNDSEFNASDDNKKSRPKKRFVAQHRKAKVRGKGYEFYDRDARYCSQMNINLDCSSTDVVKHFTGDCQNYHSYKPDVGKDFSGHDMWTVLRNINRFQFRPSPPISDESFKAEKKKKIRNKKKNNRKDSRLIETCHTEEFSYISSFEIDNNSRSSSFDRITVIDRQDKFKETFEEFEKGVVKSNKLKQKNQRQIRNKNKRTLKVDNTITQKNLKLPTNKQYNNDPKLRDDKIDYVLKEHINCRHNTVGDNASVSNIILFTPESNIIDSEVKNCNKNYQPSKETNIEVHHLRPKSGKFGLNYLHNNNTDNYEKVLKVSSDELAQPIKGITKVILSAGQDPIETKCNEIQKRKPRLNTTMPSSGTTPKLNQTDIRRRLENMKFPLKILGKDLTTTSIKVHPQHTNEEPPQNSGLDKQILPFMRKRCSYPVPENAPEASKKTGKTQLCSKYKQSNMPFCDQNKCNEINENKMNYSVINKNKSQKKQIESNELIKIKSLQPENSNRKPYHQLKDKMIKLLYKNNSVISIDEHYNTDGHDGLKYNTSISHSKVLKTTEKVDASTETNRKQQNVSAKLSKTTSIQQTKLSKLSRYPWSKGRWASDFIDNVIRKICNGVYYNKEQEYIHNIKPKAVDYKEVSTQTLLLEKKCRTATDVQVNKASSTVGLELTALNALNSMNTLPGFDEKLPVLEVKTLNMRELSIKHCTTNVMLQFDVTMPSDIESRKPVVNSSSFIPLSITKSHTRILKCETSIMNAMLPAEICSIFPVILKSIIGANRISTLPALASYHSDTNLYTISELSSSESSNVLKYPLPTGMGLSSTLTKLLNGVYSYRLSRIEKKKEHTELRFNLGSKIKDEMFCALPKIQRLIVINVHVVNNIIPHSITMVKNVPPQSFGSTAFKATECNNAVVKHNASVCYKTYDLTNLLKQMWNKNLSFCLRVTAPLDTKNQNVIANIQIKNLETKRNVFVNINNIELNCLYSRNIKCNIFEKYGLLFKQTPKAIEYKGPSKDNIDKKPSNGFLSSIKTKKKSFVKLYKKCKSTSNISRERNNTDLSKITSIDDFFHVLGTGKAMSTVFSDQIGNKILSSILEMKNWITEINQKQAMLILLLVTKKETLNLVKFRPILLQGIAVNRITQASELDMEIEVIERENFNKFSVYDGSSYVPETVENRNNLFDELYWIAKTTASDYQKPFNESSEKLLKSLLEKRKKLNPSYLRVMARYVGLGLLKSSGKN